MVLSWSKRRWRYAAGGATVAAALAAGVAVVGTHPGTHPVAMRQASLTTGAWASTHHGSSKTTSGVAGAAGTAGTSKVAEATQATQATQATGKSGTAGASGGAGASGTAGASGIAGASGTAGTAGTAAGTNAAASSCPDVNVVFARGTGEPAGLGIVGTPFASAVASDLPGKTVTDYAVNYAADFAQTSAGPGATDMSNHISALAAQCPDTQFVVGGYSQGASVTDIALGIRTVLGTGTAIPAADAGRVDAVVVFGNPLKLSGQTIAEDSTTYGSKAEEFCNTGDPVCANGEDIVAHLQYATNGDAQQGATFAAGKVTAAAG